MSFRQDFDSPLVRGDDPEDVTGDDCDDLRGREEGWVVDQGRPAALPRPLRRAVQRLMSKPDLMGLAQEERADLLALLHELTPEQWAGTSQCSS